MSLLRIVSEGWSDDRPVLLQSPERDSRNVDSASRRFNNRLQILGGREWPSLLLRMFAIHSSFPLPRSIASNFAVPHRQR